MSLEGRIIEFLDSDELRLAYVRKEERDRLHLIDPRGRNLSVSGDRVVVIHQPTSESEFPAAARQISEKVAALQSEVDIELLWQSVGSSSRELESAELAELFFGENAPETSSAVFKALLEDTLFFRRKGAQFVPKTQEQVSTEVTRRHRQREREEQREQLTQLIRQLLNSKDSSIPAGAESILDRIQHWLRHKTGDEVSTILENIAGPLRVREAAYDILARTGRVDNSRDRFLVMAGIREDFLPELITAAEQIQPWVHEATRTDYRDADAFTIDDEGTLEVDDALTIQYSDNDTIVGIHIADVSAFVGKGDLLDAEASRRSSTIYLPTVSVRMFPERLSTDLVSLKAGAERPAFTVEVRFDHQGNRVGYRILLSTVRVKNRLSYDQADAAIESGDGSLTALHRLASQLHDLRAARGAITFRRPELKIHVEGDQIEIEKINPNSPSRFLVSEMMILANGLAADFATLNSLPVIYRTQEPREAIEVDDAPQMEALTFEKLRKTFKRSRLSLTPGLHSGLGLGAYTQTSSPIRRYADLITQRQFTAMLKGVSLPHGREELLQILTTAESIEQEIRAIEDRSTNYWLLEFLSRYKKDQELRATALDGKGSIELEDYYLRARLSSPQKLQPGQTIGVQIESIDPARGEVRFKKTS
jgi:exoribonuclease II